MNTSGRFPRLCPHASTACKCAAITGSMTGKTGWFRKSVPAGRERSSRCSTSSRKEVRRTVTCLMTEVLSTCREPGRPLSHHQGFYQLNERLGSKNGERAQERAVNEVLQSARSAQ